MLRTIRINDLSLVRGERRLFSGETADVVADLRAFREFGVGYVDFNFDGTTADATGLSGRASALTA